jgi:hypothetical protein
LFNTLVRLLPVFVGVVTFGVVAVLLIGFTGEVGVLVVGVVIGLTGVLGVVGVFVFVIGLTGVVGVFVVLVIGLTAEVFTAPEAGLTVAAVLVGVVLGASGFTTEVAGFVTLEGAAGMTAGVLTPPVGRVTAGAKVPPLSTDGRTTEVTA